MTDARAVLAAENNADLYEAVFATHGLAFERRPEGFAAIDPPPPFYGHGVVTRPGGGAGLLAHLRGRLGPAVAVKDSFREIDAGSAGLRALFEADWLWSQRPGRLAPGWARVDGPDALVAWEAAWKAGSPTERRMFPPGFLDRPDVAVFARWDDGRATAGCIANLSDGAVGLSNAFGGGAAFAAAADAAASLGAGLPVVGYERGASLVAARAAGFEVTGGLRVLVPG